MGLCLYIPTSLIEIEIEWFEEKLPEPSNPHQHAEIFLEIQLSVDWTVCALLNKFLQQ